MERVGNILTKTKNEKLLDEEKEKLFNSMTGLL